MTTPSPAPYTVLARAYRPRHFGELIGQDSLVRTLTNAIHSGRIAQAYMLTGVRGVGKTTTARIIARALNYRGPDGSAGPTTGPTDDCPQCAMIAQGRHPDILEIDAASHTGVDHIRQLLESVPYAPAMARYKVTIIDEVHMLSASAFNALLKTLEEPPPHVVFVFATTEIRKVPVTILSRCQRFDLRRVDPAVLSQHYASIAAKEKVTIDSGALTLIARAADGSVRDGLSLLDRAIALGNGTVDAPLVQSMLGLSDRSQLVELTLAAMDGALDRACAILDQLTAHGADPVHSAEDMLGVVHQLSRLKVIAPTPTETVTESERLLAESAGRFTVPALTKAWQILLKGLQEIRISPQPASALEMIVFRLGYALPLPDPADLVGDGSLPGAMSGGGNKSAGNNSGNGGRSSATKVSSRDDGALIGLRSVSAHGAALRAPHDNRMPEPSPQGDVVAAPLPTNFAAAVALLEERGALALASQLAHYACPIQFEAGRIELAFRSGAPAKLAADLGAALTTITATRWWVSVVSMPPDATIQTLAQQRSAREQDIIQATNNDPHIQAIRAVFPGATLIQIDDPLEGELRP